MSMDDVMTEAEDLLKADCTFEEKWNGTPHWNFYFPNGYGASVINDGYGRESGLFELAVLDSDGNLCYTTEITDDVIGWLESVEVLELLRRIAKLPPTEKSEHEN